MIWIQAILASIFYRVGGAGPDEIPFANTKFRDFGVPVVMAWALCDRGGYIWSDYLFVVGACILLFPMLTTYWDDSKNVILDSIAKLINWQYPRDNFYLHGLFCGLAMIPLYWTGIHWYLILAYAVALSASIGLLNYVVNKFPIPFKVWVEELLRGLIIILAMQILFIC